MNHRLRSMRRLVPAKRPPHGSAVADRIVWLDPQALDDLLPETVRTDVATLDLAFARAMETLGHEPVPPSP